jgi:Glyoxalase-like domain
MRLDHLSYAAGPEGLAACVQRLGSRLGAGFTDGGLHPRFGTRNFVLALAGGSYLEVVAALDHPAADSAPFGRAVKARSEQGGGWLGWAVSVDDLAPVEQRLGRAAAPGHRRRPDGFDLRWRQIGVNDLAADNQFPFYLQWETDAAHHPSNGGSPIALTGLQFAGELERVEGYLDAPVIESFPGISFEWNERSDDDSGLVAAYFTTVAGDVRLD